MYCVYWNQASAAYLSLYFVSFLSLQFSNIKIFHHTFFRNCEAWKVDTWYTRGQWADVLCIPESGCCCLFVPLFFIFLSLKFTNIKIFCHSFLRNCEAWKVDTWYTRGQWADVSCILESGCCCCLFIPVFLHFPFSPIFKIFKFSSHFSQEL